MSFVTTVIKVCRRHCDGNGLGKSEISNANDRIQALQTRNELRNST
jgi:hypothetical protein